MLLDWCGFGPLPRRLPCVQGCQILMLAAMCHLQVTCMAWDEKERYLATSDGAEATIWSVSWPSRACIRECVLLAMLDTTWC